MNNIAKGYRRSLILILFTMVSLFNQRLFAQDKSPYVRIAKIVIDSAQIESYNTALKIHAEAAVSKEPGVLTLYGVYDKNEPTHVIVFEIYASVAAYNSHIQTPHFLKYKSTVENMVKSLVLTDVIPISLQAKSKALSKFKKP